MLLNIVNQNPGAFLFRNNFDSVGSFMAAPETALPVC